MRRKWYDAIEEVIALTVVLQTSSLLDWPPPYILSGLIAVLNLPSLFPSEDLRYRLFQKLFSLLFQIGLIF